MDLVPDPALQVDIFVTRAPKDTKPKSSDDGSGGKPPRLSSAPGNNNASSMEDVSLNPQSRIPIQVVPPESDNRLSMATSTFSDDHNSLLMPNPYDNPDARYGDGGLKGQDYDYEMGLGPPGQFQEDRNYDVLDYTHFNGDLDAEIIPAEESFSSRLRQEGAMRRKMTRKLARVDQEKLWADLGQEVSSPTVVGPPSSEYPSTGHGQEPHHAQTLPGGGDNGHMGQQTRRSSAPSKYGELGQRGSGGSRERRADRTSMISIRDKISDVSTVQAMLPKTGEGARGEEVALQFDDDELEDLLAMTEFAWPGRPMLDKLLKEEVDRAKGPLVIACACSPSSPFLLPSSDPRGFIS